MSSAERANTVAETDGDAKSPAFACRIQRYDTLTSWHVWQCPLCDHSLKYGDGQEDIVALAVASHMTRRHIGQIPTLTGVRPCA